MNLWECNDSGEVLLSRDFHVKEIAKVHGKLNYCFVCSSLRDWYSTLLLLDKVFRRLILRVSPEDQSGKGLSKNLLIVPEGVQGLL